MFGPLDLEKIQTEFYEPLSFETSISTFDNLNTKFSQGEKTIELYHDQSESLYNVDLTFRISSIGRAIVTLDIKINKEMYSSIYSERFSGKFGELKLDNVTIQEIVWKISSYIFGTSLVGFQLEADLNTKIFKDFCSKYEIKNLDSEIYLNVTSMFYITDIDEFNEIKKLEELKKEKYGGSVLPSTIVVPNLSENKILSGINAHILFSTSIILFCDKKLSDSLKDLLLSILFRSIGLRHLITILSKYQSQIHQLNYYISQNRDDEQNISWIFIDDQRKKIDLQYRLILDTYEKHFVETQVYEYYNFEAIDRIDKLEEYFEYSTYRELYTEKQKSIERQLSNLHKLVSDKGEKEEQQATERIVTVIGLLAFFEVISEILPLFSDEVANNIRIGFIVTVIPFLLIIWLYTHFNNKTKIVNAEEMQEKVNLSNHKKVLQNNIRYLKEGKFIELFELSDEYIESEIQKLEKKLKEVENRLRSLQN